jgi:hypothetical protein
MGSIRKQSSFTAVLLGAGLLLLSNAGSARASSFDVTGMNGTGASANVSLAYTSTSATSGTLQITVANTTGASSKKAAITGLALNLPTNVAGISDFTFSSTDRKARGFSAFINPGSVGAGGFSDFDLGITNDKNLAKKAKKAKKGNAQASISIDPKSIDSGNPQSGSHNGYQSVFTIQLTGTGLDNLDVRNFLSEFAHGTGGQSSDFAVGFQGVGQKGKESDLGCLDVQPAAAVPEPCSLLLLGAGLTAALVRRSTRRR